MNALTIKARSLARKTGLIWLINRVRLSKSDPYEDHFNHALQRAIHPGDVVWDVGANVGLYTERFSQWAAPGGVVVAFEPLLESMERIRERTRGVEGVIVRHAALGATDGTAQLLVTEGSQDCQIAAEGASTAGLPTTAVTVCRGDTMCAELGRTPNVVKIDVEGFEEEVLKGMPEMLARPELRCVLLEVHFSKLEQCGEALAPARIEKLLRGKGFQLKWVDPSHLRATRA